MRGIGESTFWSDVFAIAYGIWSCKTSLESVHSPKTFHNSTYRRDADLEYRRPGNLIIGGGGRGVRKAPKELGIGEWEILKGEDDPIGKVYVRKGPSLEKQIDKATHG